jgi:hypothetical protein
MKQKTVLLVTVFLAMSLVTFGQKAFQNHSNYVNAGIGFLGITWKGLTYGVSYERSVSDQFGVGAHVGYSQYTKDGYSYTAVLFGAKGNYHFLTSAKVDPYVGAELGYVSISHTGTNKVVSPHSYSPVGLGIYGGARYYIAPAVGIYGELHLSTFSIFSAGICFKL